MVLVSMMNTMTININIKIKKTEKQIKTKKQIKNRKKQIKEKVFYTDFLYIL